MSDEIEFESGPYCSHWADPSECTEICECGHECCRHYIFDRYCLDCECKSFIDKQSDEENAG